jgi:hypothetical protein
MIGVAAYVSVCVLFAVQGGMLDCWQSNMHSQGREKQIIFLEWLLPFSSECLISLADIWTSKN